MTATGAAALSENPLVEGLERLPVHPTSLVIFGATGDLANRKLLPAIYNLAHDGALPERFELVGTSRSDMSDAEFRDMATNAVRQFSRRTPDDSVLERLFSDAAYVAGTFDDEQLYGGLREALERFDQEAGQRLNRCFYLSTAPTFFPVIVERLGAEGLSALDGADVRVIIEKPFGTTLAEAQELNRQVLSVFAEAQVFRIDHYLGKETVQNIMAFRFANGMFEPLWNRNYIDNVQITAAEDIGIGSRAGYYDSAGALRDLIQNHMLQLLCHVAMEPPVDFSADEVRNEKVKVLHAIERPSAEDIGQMAVRAQYTAGQSGGEQVPGYLDEEGVPEDSHTETYAAIRLEVDNWRWAGVPFYLRHGKRLPKRSSEISIRFKPTPQLLFGMGDAGRQRPNVLTLRIQPDEGIALRFGSKVPGPGMHIRSVLMDFRFGTSFGRQTADAYERLILDAMQGDSTLFTRRDETEAAWTIVTSILEGWQHLPPPEFPNYEAGTWGPRAARDLLAREGRAWARL